MILKLFPRVSDHRTTIMVISMTGESLDRSAGLETNPWKVITETAQESRSSLEKALCWLSLLSRSGIEVPLDIYKQFTSVLIATGSPLRESCSFIKAMLASLWLRSLGRQRLQPLLASFHLSLIPKIHKALQEVDMRPVAYVVLRVGSDWLTHLPYLQACCRPIYFRELSIALWL